MVLPRSYLYVPGNAPDKLAKAAGRGADALIVDLEDAVPVAEKDAALAAVLAWLATGPVGAGGPEVWVRVNPGARRLDEVRALAGSPFLTGIVLAKTEDATEVDAVAATAAPDQLLMPMVETPGAVLDARLLAAGPRVRCLQVGEVDLAGEIRLDVSADEGELAPYRALVVAGSAAAGVAPPPGPVSREVRDLEVFAASTKRLLRQGFHGRVCIHPAQVAVVHELLVPSAERVAEAEATLALLAAAEAAGSGVVLDDAGRLVDAAVLHEARRVLELAER
ncbi:aldolase/citrate lyase family protein [Nocardioides sp. C4-1]|uniref:HpcH/HpaI aldolase/citrate lyase family protein n=1 Tax=Nocardioides sp. C4-1 TaxID=3151851 RepID=UPI0032641501